MADGVGDFRDAARGHIPASAGFDVTEYAQFIEDLPLTEEQKAEFLRNVWNIMSAFVNWGFGVDSVLPLLIQNSLEKDGVALQEPVPTHEFNVAADDIGPEKEGPS